MDEAAGRICSVCRIAWREGMMSGWSGNASVRIGKNVFAITRAGSAKGFIEPGDCLLVNDAGQVLAGAGSPSSETALHLALYAASQSCNAILHTHPVCMQALNLLLGGRNMQEREFLRLPLYESRMWRQRLFLADALAPGSPELAQSAAKSLPNQAPLPCAIWLPEHGLCAMAENLLSALCMSEELEHLANVQLKTL